MTPDRHLGAAWIDKCRPNILISESTYATTIRDSKRCRERDFLKKVHDCVDRGGKVLIPVFALGRAQELCILLETYWERMNLKAPIYFAVGLTEKVTKQNFCYVLTLIMHLYYRQITITKCLSRGQIKRFVKPLSNEICSSLNTLDLLTRVMPTPLDLW